jgi:hypothetical protein
LNTFIGAIKATAAEIGEGERDIEVSDIQIID